MNKHLLVTTLLLLFLLPLRAQASKWLDKHKRAVFSVVTYDKEDKILNTGNGFFVTEDGVAMSNYAIFKGAQRAVVLTTDGKQLSVKNIMGANDMYDVIKFRVETDKKVPALAVASTGSAAWDNVFILPYSTQKDKRYSTGKVKEVSSIAGGHAYYTLAIPLRKKLVSCPVMNEKGEVIGIAQQAVGKDTTSICYAVSASFIMKQTIAALSLGTPALQSISIRKALPEKEKEALVYLMMASSYVNPEEYLAMLGDFIEMYPNSSDGYLRRASHYFYQDRDDTNLEAVEADFARAVNVADKKEDVYYNISNLIYTYQVNRQPETPFKDWTLDRALEEIRKAIAIDPLPVYTLQEANVLYAMGKYEEAAASYAVVNKSNVASPATFYSEAKAREYAGAELSEVIQLMDSVMAFYPTSIPAEAVGYVLERGHYKMDAGEYREAVTDYDAYYSAVRGNVNDVFYYLRAQAAFHGRQYQRALDDIAKAISLNPKVAGYLVEQGTYNLRVGRFQDAINSLDAAIKLDPENPGSYRMKGYSQIQLGMQSEGCSNLQKAKELGDEAAENLLEKHCK
ncbi:MAG: tetratricopeptide repeat protein [Bacteroides sp.]|nr:tetratricopeptide repeat protein [Bacteroides sp.]